MNESEEESPSIPEKNSFVEQVTLELLMNKSQYHKYVSKNNPEEFGAIQTQHKDLDTYKDSILELTEELLTNKYKNVRAALCWTPEIAELAIKHNNANILALPARYITDQEGLQILNTFLSTEFEGGRHERRVNKISCV